MVDGMVLESIYKNKKVFITGHTGFKGAWLITWLSKLGAVIKGYSLPAVDSNALYNIIKKNVSHESVLNDIRDLNGLKKELLDFQPDFIFHLAAQSLVRRSYEIPSETFEVNAIGTANLLESAIHLKKPCVIIVITTDKVYENNESRLPFEESDRLGGFDPYSSSKACAEIVTSSFIQSFFSANNYHSHGKKIASARAGNVIGGGDYSDDRIIPDIIKALSAGEEIIVRNPLSIRPWQHVLEPLSGYLLLAGLMYKSSLVYSQAYNFGPEADDHLTVGELADIAIRTWGSGKWIKPMNQSDLHEASTLKLDISKAKTELHWHPKLSSEDAILWTIDWYKTVDDKKLAFTFEQISKYEAL